jgi:hypothetical protein
VAVTADQNVQQDLSHCCPSNETFTDEQVKMIGSGSLFLSCIGYLTTLFQSRQYLDYITNELERIGKEAFLA